MVTAQTQGLNDLDVFKKKKKDFFVKRQSAVDTKQNKIRSYVIYPGVRLQKSEDKVFSVLKGCSAETSWRRHEFDMKL